MGLVLSLLLFGRTLIDGDILLQTDWRRREAGRVSVLLVWRVR